MACASLQYASFELQNESLIVVCLKIILAWETIVKLDRALIVCKLAKIVSLYSFQVPSSQNHASVKLLQAEHFLEGNPMESKQQQDYRINIFLLKPNIIQQIKQFLSFTKW